ncbi:hypothetical protein D6C89_02350 [Aureobasidium pullulans]|nr:hypothetical protein D6D03_04224 [Aureobasidium pullulans]THZ28933.1 hypothetical protein D6C89_02350 [Aureobasidium pullulans]
MSLQQQSFSLSDLALQPMAYLISSTLVIPMVETLEALELVEKFAAVEGVDPLLIGTNNLTAEMGISGDYDNPGLTEAYEKIIAL